MDAPGNGLLTSVIQTCWRFNPPFQKLTGICFYKDVILTTPYDAFLSEYSRLFEKCFPLQKTKRNNLKRIRTPWITKGLLISVRKKNRLYKKMLNAPSTEREMKYKAYKNKLNHLIRIAKRTYYNERFENARNDIKQTWKLINEVINNKKKNTSFPLSFKSDGKTITDPLEIANRFCKYFTNIGPNLSSKIPPTNSSFRSFLSENENETLSIQPSIYCLGARSYL